MYYSNCSIKIVIITWVVIPTKLMCSWLQNTSSLTITHYFSCILTFLICLLEFVACFQEVLLTEDGSISESQVLASVPDCHHYLTPTTSQLYSSFFSQNFGIRDKQLEKLMFEKYPYIANSVIVNSTIMFHVFVNVHTRTSNKNTIWKNC